MAEITTSGFCLPHDRHWRSKFQGYLNQICNPPRRHPLVDAGDIKRITKAVCTCKDDTNNKWSRVDQRHFASAHEHYKNRLINNSSKSVYRELYNDLQGLFKNHGPCANRLIFVIVEIEELQSTNILQEISGRARRQPVDPIHLGSLKTSNIGRYIGRGGIGIREAIYDLPVGNINLDIKVPQDNDHDDTAEVYATYSCRPRDSNFIRDRLHHRLLYYQEEQPIPHRFRQPYPSRHARRPTPGDDTGHHEPAPPTVNQGLATAAEVHQRQSPEPMEMDQALPSTGSASQGTKRKK